jgi:hypothetical protein
LKKQIQLASPHPLVQRHGQFSYLVHQPHADRCKTSTRLAAAIGVDKVRCMVVNPAPQKKKKLASGITPNSEGENVPARQRAKT